METQPSTGTVLPIPEDIATLAGKAKDRDPVLGVPNWAGLEDTAKAAIAFAKAQWSMFDAQSARATLMADMNDADKFYRMSDGIAKSDTNLTLNAVDSVPHIFYEGVRMVTAYETNLLYSGTDPIGRYEPYNQLDPLLAGVTDDICKQQQLLFEYSNDVDNRISQLRLLQLFLNKYKVQLIGMDWCSEEMSVTERVPEVAADGSKIGMKWTTTVKKKQHPRLFRYDMKDVWLDTAIADIQDQQCVLLRSDMELVDIINEQKTGHFANVEKITTAHAFQGETPSTTVSDRQANAGESADSDRPNGRYERWDAFIRAPIDKKGKWDEKGTLRAWHLFTFIGPLATSDVVCVRAIPNPYKRLNQLPLKLIHSHPDDKGAINSGYVNYIRPVWNEMKTTLDQWFDNKDLVNRAPIKMEEGAILTKDKSFGPRKLLTMKRGSFDKVERLAIPSNTNDMQAFIGYLQQKAWDIFGTQKVFRGEAMGGRTSSAEAQNARDQAMLTAIEKARYNADQILPWLAETDEDMWRQFAPPDLVVALTREGQKYEIKPAEIYGHLRYRVLAIDQNQNTAMERLEQDRFVQTGLPIAAKYMGDKGVIEFLKWMYRGRRMPVEKMFPAAKDADARHVAKSENYGFMNGQWDQPEMPQDHDVHIMEHMQLEAVLQTINPDQRPPNALEYVRTHRTIHEQMKTQGAGEPSMGGMPGGMQPGGPQQGMPNQPTQEAGPMPGTPGEMAQDMLGAEGGIQGGLQ